LFIGGKYNQSMQIEQVTLVTEELCEALQRLIPQLTANRLPPTRQELEMLVSAECSILLIVRHPETGKQIVGAGSLTVYRVPTGVRAIIEDVIVDESARGLGIGESLVRRLMEFARNKGANGVALTSNPRRASANRLYQRIGFVRRDTNAYFYKF
jgi:ribosomal protein S18 acetylase RimI-like enzyme